MQSDDIHCSIKKQEGCTKIYQLKNFPKLLILLSMLSHTLSQNYNLKNLAKIGNCNIVKSHNK